LKSSLTPSSTKGPLLWWESRRILGKLELEATPGSGGPFRR
jgi:hypothetical protein